MSREYKTHRIHHPKEQLDWLRENRNRYHYEELTSVFNEKFGTDYSTPKLYGICDSYGIKTNKPRQTPARTLPKEWIPWMKKESVNYSSYEDFRKAFNTHYGTHYRSGSAFKHLCDRAGVEIIKPESFKDFAEVHFDEIKAFCQANWINLSRQGFTKAFNAHFNTEFNSEICTWMSDNADRLGIKHKAVRHHPAAPSEEEIALFRTKFKSMKSKDFAVLCNQTIGTAYNDRQATHRAAWLAEHGYLKDSDVRKRKKTTRKGNSSGDRSKIVPVGTISYVDDYSETRKRRYIKLKDGWHDYNRWLYESAYGPLPEGRWAILFRDGNENNVSPENLYAIPHDISCYMGRLGAFQTDPAIMTLALATARVMKASGQLFQKAKNEDPSTYHAMLDARASNYNYRKAWKLSI